jgi:hypothetical protein
MRKINLGLEPNIAKVYNVLPDNKPVVNLTNYNRMNITQGGSTQTIVQTEFVTSFVDRNRISASVSSVKIVPATKQPGDVIPTAKGQTVQVANIPLKIEQISETDKVYQQGEGPIGISPFDNFYQFIIYNNAVSNALGVGEPQLLDLTQVGTMYINFFDQATGLKIKLKSYTNIKDINPANGEVVFKIPSEDSNKILGLTDKTYYISTVLETGGGTSEETLLYTGTWYNAKDKTGKVASDTIQDLQTSFDQLSTSSNNTIDVKNKQIDALKAEVDYQNQYINSLQAKISELGGNISDIQNSLSAAQDALATQQETYQQAIAGVTSAFNQSVSSLTSTLVETIADSNTTGNTKPANSNNAATQSVLQNQTGGSISQIITR